MRCVRRHWQSGCVEAFEAQHHVTVTRNDLLKLWMQHFCFWFMFPQMGTQLVQTNQTHQMHRHFFFNGCAGERREGYFLLHLRLKLTTTFWLLTYKIPMPVIAHVIVHSRFGPRWVALVTSLGLSKTSITVAQVRMISGICPPAFLVAFLKGSVPRWGHWVFGVFRWCLEFEDSFILGQLHWAGGL